MSPEYVPIHFNIGILRYVISISSLHGKDQEKKVLNEVSLIIKTSFLMR